MRSVRFLFCLILVSTSPLFGAFFGTTVNLIGGPSDIVLDEGRGRLYIVNNTASNIQVYSTSQKRFLNSIRTDVQPVSAAMSRSGKFLYVTSNAASALDIIDLDKQSVGSKITLPAQPEAVAVGNDERVLITTTGTGPGNLNNSLLIYDPSAAAGNNIISVAQFFPPPPSPQLPPPSNRIYLGYPSHLTATPDGRFIMGVNRQGTGRLVFVYEVASGTVLRSRNVSNLSNVLSVAPDGSKFMAGLTLFDAQTLTVMAQQNASNAPFYFPAGNNTNANTNQFNTQQNQGGSVFSPDGTTLYSAFNIAPVQNPAARANTSHFLVNDADNLLIKQGFQLSENLIGKMVVTGDGRTIYALSESGFMILPVSDLGQATMAMPQTSVAVLENDQCGVYAQQASSVIPIENSQKKPLNVSVQLVSVPTAGPGGLGGFGGPGGGGPGGPIIIPIIIGGGFFGGIGGNFGAPAGNQNATQATAPAVQGQPSPTGMNVRFQFNPNAARSPGTITPHDFLVQSPEAVNLPPILRIFQNNRDSDSKGAIMPVRVAASMSEGLVDMLPDNTRQRLYIANSGMNQVEVFDMRRQVFLTPIKVGQLPHSLALGNDGVTLYVANTGGESISIVNLDKGQTVGQVKFPPYPFNAGVSLVFPSAIANSQRGLQLVMSDGSLWKVVGDEALPRTLNPSVFGSNVRTVAAGNPAVRTLTATPGGEYVLLFTPSTGNAYLFDAQADEWVIGKQVLSTIGGLLGPAAAGPRGQYYIVNGTLLNSALTPMDSAGGLPNVGPIGGGGIPPRGGAAPTTTARPVAAVAAVANSTYARFTEGIRTTNNAPASDAGMVELVDLNTGLPMRQAMALESPLATANGNQRVAINGRTMAVDASGSTAYVLTTSGLSIVPLDAPNPQNRPAVSPNGVVSIASYLPATAPGGLVGIFGRNLAASDTGSSTPLPTILGGTCVTLNNQPAPLMMTSSGQINLQVPPTLPPGRYPLVVRSIDQKAASAPATLTVSKYAPAVFVDSNGQAAIFHQDGRAVGKDAPAKRDEHFVIYATGLGATKGGKVTPGVPSPSSPVAVTDKVQVFFGDSRYKEAEMIVNWSGLAPGFIGLNQINITVPGAHIKGNALPVTLRIGGVNSPAKGPAVPVVAVE